MIYQLVWDIWDKIFFYIPISIFAFAAFFTFKLNPDLLYETALRGEASLTPAKERKKQDRVDDLPWQEENKKVECNLELGRIMRKSSIM